MARLQTWQHGPVAREGDSGEGEENLPIDEMLGKVDPNLGELLDTLEKQGSLNKEGHGGPSLPSSPIAAALSGGGHRASLFALGALMAMHDAEMEPLQVSSVSGGSVTNLYLAHHRGDGSEPAWQDATESLFRLIVDRGVLTPGWLTVIAAFYAAPLIALVAVGVTIGLPPWPWLLLVAALWFTAVLLRGLLVEELMARRYFGRSGSRVTWAGLDSTPERVVCATDLVTGRPFYASTQRQTVFRRTDDPAELELPQTTVAWNERTRPVGVTCEASGLRVSALLRASAGFPGIPPRRLRLAQGCTPSGSVAGHDLAPVAFLSDGGIWNNLATQPFEERFLFDPYGPWIVLVVDASAALPPARPLAFRLPGVAEVAALLRQTVILNANTVWPRRRAFYRDVHWEMTNRFHARFRTERLYPVIALSERPLDAVRRLAIGLDVDDPYSGFYEQAHAEDVAMHRRQFLQRARELEASERFQLLHTAAGLEGTEVDTVADVPTSLSRIDADIALALVVRGYANTAATLYITGIAPLAKPTGWLHAALPAQPP